jgi:hypothetical protein
VSSHELTEWMAYATLEPFAWEADYFGHAITAATIANANRGKNQKEFTVEDFMPKFEKQNQNTEQMKQIAAMLTIANGGVDLREGE